MTRRGAGEMKRFTIKARSHTVGTLVVGCSVALLAWCWWPRGEAMQLIQLRRADGSVQRFARNLSAGELNFLRRRIENRDVTEPVAKIAWHRWLMETASHYDQLNQVKPQPAENDADDAVVPVSYETTSSAESLVKDDADTARSVDWKRLADHNRVVLANIDQRVQELRRELGESPVQLLGTVPGPIAPWCLPVSLMLAIASGAAHALWCRCCPGWRLTAIKRPPSADDSVGHSGHETAASVSSVDAVLTDDAKLSHQLPIALPKDWIEIRQGAQFHVRRLLVISVACAALLSVWNVTGA
ncbi:hypothetical protein V7x_29480 [Crateriforma conspicua]|uniref:Uncharacterized protein n=1 Tax=Crateriforma conspicua TaxID=2527996 RepID=A0A5C6FYG5_9PLAN|nr:hypothetical protein [Crateriforma conspicua]TWU67374.1 hypothetical protein V7x_29480 [Crateriforma conspicua]